MTSATQTIKNSDNRTHVVVPQASHVKFASLQSQCSRQLDTAADPESRPTSASQRTQTRNIALNIVLIVAGCIAVVAGIVGIILPGLPTTPFLLLASWCFSRSSQTLNRTLHAAPYLGPALTRWQKHKAVTLQVKFTAVAMMLATFLLAMLSETLPEPAKYLIAVVVTCVMFAVVRLRTLNTIDLQQM